MTFAKRERRIGDVLVVLVLAILGFASGCVPTPKLVTKPLAPLAGVPAFQVSGHLTVSVWVEVNYKEDPYYSDALRGLQIFSTVFDEAWVSSTPEACEAVYSALARDIPHLRIRPGVKTKSPLDGRIDNAPGWGKVAEAVRRACTLTGSDSCLIENETGWKTYLDGEYIPDWQQVRAGLELLPKEVHHLWYPASWGRTEAARERSTKFLRLVVEVLPSVTLVGHEWCQTKAPDDAYYQNLHAMDVALDVPLVSLCWFYDRAVRPQDWDADSLPRLLSDYPGDALIIHTGSSNWPATAQSVGHALHDFLQAEYHARLQQMAVARDLIVTAAEQLECP